MLRIIDIIRGVKDREGSGEVYLFTHSEVYMFFSIVVQKQKTEKTWISLWLENVII